MAQAAYSSAPRWVYKLGGGTVANSERICHSLASIPAREGTVLIVSAPAGITDQLCAVDQARRQGQEREARARLHQVVKVFQDLAKELLPAHFAAAYIEHWQGWAREQGLRASRARLLARGELWNTQLIAQYLTKQGRPARALDARQFIVAEAEGAEAEVCQLAACLPPLWEIPVITGFIARDQFGQDHTLGRDGSDYTAALVAEALVSEGLAQCGDGSNHSLALYFLTDTPGIRSADPRRLQAPGLRIPCIGHREARTLVHWGGGVLHPRTIRPLARAQIRAWVGQPNGADEEHRGMGGQGTWLVPGNHWPAGGLGLFIVGSTHAGVAENEHSNDQANTNTSARLVLPMAVGNDVLSPEQQRLETQIHRETLQACCQYWPYSDHYGAGLEISPTASLADGSSETALTGLLHQVHQKLYEEVRQIRLVLLGPGLVGRELLRQLQQVDLLWRLEHGLAVEVSQVVNSQGILSLADPDQLPWYDPASGRMLNRDSAALIFVDTTASMQVAMHHRNWLEQGAGVVTANKHGLSAELEPALSLLRNPLYGANTTVGAGLPFLYQLSQGQGQGLKIKSFEAILSGSVNYLLDQLEQGCSYADALAQAQRLGLLEPEPSADLEGWDSARKLLILARALGLNACIEQIQHQALITGADPSPLLTQVQQAQQRGECVRYVAAWDGQGLSLAPRTVSRHSPLAVRGCDNLLWIENEVGQRHSISGPGAGPVVTAQGLLRDLLFVAQTLVRSERASRAA